MYHEFPGGLSLLHDVLQYGGKLEIGGVPFYDRRRQAGPGGRLSATTGVWSRSTTWTFGNTRKSGRSRANEETSYCRPKPRSGVESTLRARTVVVATGGFHEPNYLDVPGEDLPKVKHYYQEPYPFYDQDVLVVGAGNSSVESAPRNHTGPWARVSIVHIFDEIDRGVKPWVVPDIQNRLKNGEIGVYWRHRIQEIRLANVVLWNMDSEETVEIANDWVLAMTGWRPDRRFISGLGDRYR